MAAETFLKLEFCQQKDEHLHEIHKNSNASAVTFAETLKMQNFRGHPFKINSPPRKIKALVFSSPAFLFIEPTEKPEALGSYKNW